MGQIPSRLLPLGEILNIIMSSVALVDRVAADCCAVAFLNFVYLGDSFLLDHVAHALRALCPQQLTWLHPWLLVRDCFHDLSDDLTVEALRSYVLVVDLFIGG